MKLTMPEVIGRNVKARREQLGMTAAALGERIGEIFGKPWPRQTVYMMENGKRAMVADELAALSQILGTPISTLLDLPPDAMEITVGNVQMRPEIVTPGDTVSFLQELEMFSQAVEFQTAIQHLDVRAYVPLMLRTRNLAANNPELRRHIAEELRNEIERVRELHAKRDRSTPEEIASRLRNNPTPLMKTAEDILRTLPAKESDNG